MQNQFGFAPGVGDHFDVSKADSADAGAEGFADGFFDGVTAGEAGEFTSTVGLFLGCKDAIAHFVAEAVDAALDPFYFDDVYASC